MFMPHWGVAMHLRRRLVGGMGVHLQRRVAALRIWFAMHCGSGRAPDREKHCKQEQQKYAKQLHEGQIRASATKNLNSKACPHGKVNKPWKRCGATAASGPSTHAGIKR